MVRIAVNGLGRIGRCVVRALIEEPRDDIELVAVNGPAPIETHVHLLKYDSVHGTCKDVAKKDDNTLILGGKEVPLFRERDPLNLPWDKLDVDVVLECTGFFKTKETAGKHIEAGAKKVLISAPAGDDSPMIVYGVNNDDLTEDVDVLSIGSCTTNCLAPFAKVLNESVGIESAFMTTIHAYTGDQNILDGSHKDLRRARAAGVSMVPTSTGAAKAVGKVIPSLQGKFDGVALRVPTPNVSMVDLTFTSSKNTTAEEINEIVKSASEGELKGVLGYNDEPLVSIDYNHNPNSSIFDSTGTKVLNGNLVRVVSWYDNEWGFSIRMLDVAVLLEKFISNGVSNKLKAVSS